MISTANTPFHDAETAIQARFGLAEQLAVRYKGFIRPQMPQQHRDFYAALPMVIAGMTDKNGKVWALPLFGQKGFVQTPSETQLCINAQMPLSKIMDLNIEANSKIGLLGIELETRRRNRVNGVIQDVSSQTVPAQGMLNTYKNEPQTYGLAIKVDQSYGNCPQYIHKREIDLDETQFLVQKELKFEKSTALSTKTISMIEQSDTFFIASRTRFFSEDPRSGIDASHRGGTTGFVKVIGNSLRFPDFSGNKFFNTIGNIQDDGRVGLFFPNFINGDALFISGKGKVLWDENLTREYEGAERFIEIECEEIINMAGFMPVKGSLVETSPSFSGKALCRA